MTTMYEINQRGLCDDKMSYMSGDLSKDNFDECIKQFCDIYLENSMKTLKSFQEEAERQSYEWGYDLDFSDPDIRRDVGKSLRKSMTPYKWSSLLCKFYLYCKNKRVDEAKDIFDQLNEIANQLSVDYLDHNDNLIYEQNEERGDDNEMITKGEGAFILIMNQIRDQLDNAKFVLDIISEYISSAR
jgi:hypothetical protein